MATEQRTIQQILADLKATPTAALIVELSNHPDIERIQGDEWAEMSDIVAELQDQGFFENAQTIAEMLLLLFG